MALLKRESLTMKVAGMEISVSEAARKSGEDLAALQERVACLESLRAAAAPRERPSYDDARAPADYQALKSILWVDDYPSNNAFDIEKLEREGFRVRKEITTSGGLRAVAEEPFGLVITDLGRNEAGEERPFAGLELIEKLRAKGFTAPVLVFGGRRGIEHRDRLLQVGADEVTSSMVDVWKFIERKFGQRSEEDITTSELMHSSL